MGASAATEDQGEAATGGFLGAIERAGNKVPHPVIIFLYLIVGVIVLSAILDLLTSASRNRCSCPPPGRSR